MSLIGRKVKKKYIFLVTFCLLIFTVYLGLTFGAVPISLQDIWQVLISTADDRYESIIIDLRLPRIIIGLLVGACLATSGALLQGVMKNPLADPGIIGVSAGGGLMAIITMLIFPQYSYLLPIMAFIGAFATTIVIYLLAWENGTSTIKIILAGVAMNALLGAVMNGVMVIYSDRVQSVISWLSGGLNGRSWYHLEFMYPYAIVGLLISFFAIKPINIILLGDESAKLLGQNVELMRLLLILLASFLAGIAVSVSGLIGFVGLVVPHFIRLLIGEDYRMLLPLSMLGGAILVVFADTIARTMFEPIELPVGILLACIGAPFFLFLLRRKRVM
ncbi:FecCD family ABC transporter permease [Paraliobacillus sediminis]|uniref:FecCD family ABC transporter permease n=1 Tax=Paraliobacillus sediminis TaxID=1885916 RepID=UPI000E3CFA92|nr:iron ABC transporter permease [Paraliobacillus sediminis]